LEGCVPCADSNKCGNPTHAASKQSPRPLSFQPW
jgi:hypothetical protein